jgi:predicted O-methyltransferase YrrM
MCNGVQPQTSLSEVIYSVGIEHRHCGRNMNSVQELLASSPKFHRDSKGSPVSWQLDESALYYIDKHLENMSRTLETGAGVSTILFAMKATNHVCIVPDASQIDRITKFCEQNRLQTDRITFLPDKSENVLPKLGLSGLDLVLIDGRHAFPTPFIDWYYTTSMLRTGGLLIVDDVHLWTGRVLREYLLSELEWGLEHDFPRTSVFVKRHEVNQDKVWVHQRFLVQRSRAGLIREQIRYAIGQIRSRLSAIDM